MSADAPMRLSGKPVPAFFPDAGEVEVLIYGEAPGPRGADQSGIPFWGDGAGVPLYRALEGAGRAVVPEAAWGEWDGARFREMGIRPELRGAALSNAYPMCPTDDGRKFRAPKRGELQGAANVARLEGELARGVERGARRVITLGRCAAATLELVAARFGLELVAFPHPSSQGLLMSAPGKGRGMRLADLRLEWERRLVAALG